MALSRTITRKKNQLCYAGDEINSEVSYADISDINTRPYLFKPCQVLSYLVYCWSSSRLSAQLSPWVGSIVRGV